MPNWSQGGPGQSCSGRRPVSNRGAPAPRSCPCGQTAVKPRLATGVGRRPRERAGERDRGRAGGWGRGRAGEGQGYQPRSGPVFNAGSAGQRRTSSGRARPTAGHDRCWTPTEGETNLGYGRETNLGYGPCLGETNLGYGRETNLGYGPCLHECGGANKNDLLEIDTAGETPRPDRTGPNRKALCRSMPQRRWRTSGQLTAQPSKEAARGEDRFRATRSTQQQSRAKGEERKKRNTAAGHRRGGNQVANDGRARAQRGAEERDIRVPSRGGSKRRAAAGRHQHTRSEEQGEGAKTGRAAETLNPKP